MTVIEKFNPAGLVEVAKGAKFESTDEGFVVTFERKMLIKLRDAKAFSEENIQLDPRISQGAGILLDSQNS